MVPAEPDDLAGPGGAGIDLLALEEPDQVGHLEHQLVVGVAVRIGVCGASQGGALERGEDGKAGADPAVERQVDVVEVQDGLVKVVASVPVVVAKAEPELGAAIVVGRERIGGGAGGGVAVAVEHHAAVLDEDPKDAAQGGLDFEVAPQDAGAQHDARRVVQERTDGGRVGEVEPEGEVNVGRGADGEVPGAADLDEGGGGFEEGTDG